MGTHPIFESDFDCLTDIFKMPRSNVRYAARISHALRMVSDALRESGLDLSEFVHEQIPANQPVQIASFLGATEVLRDTFEDYASNVGGRRMLTKEKFVEFCYDVNRGRRIPTWICDQIFQYHADKDHNDLLDFQEFVSILLDQNLIHLLNIN